MSKHRTELPATHQLICREGVVRVWLLREMDSSAALTSSLGHVLVSQRSHEHSLGHQTSTHIHSIILSTYSICLSRGLMSGQTKAGSAYHGAKRQLIGTSASQVAPADRKSVV